MASLRPRQRPTLIGLAVGLVFAVAALLITWSLVRDDVTRANSAGIGNSGPYRFVGGVTGLAGVVGFMIGRRLVGGRTLRRRGWFLSMGQVVPTAESYRTAAPPGVQQLIDALAGRGYRLDAAQVDAGGAATGPIDGRTSLVGSAFRLRDARLGPDGTGVVIRISERAGDAGGGLGNVEAFDAGGSTGNEELATFAIAELGALLPDVRYRADDSSLGADPTDLLRATLPDRPRAL